MSKKIERGDPLVSSGFGYAKKVKNERGPFAITWMPFPGIRLLEQAEFYLQKFCPIRVCLKEKQNKTGTSKVGAISKAQKAQFSKYAQDVFMKSFENTFETPKVCLSCSIWLENHFSRLETKKFLKFFLKNFFFEKNFENVA